MPITLVSRLRAGFSERTARVLVGGVLCAIFFAIPHTTHAARLIVSPASGTFVVGGTFDVSILLDTEGEAVNALDIVLKFPTDKLQVSSPTSGQSIVGVWTGPPDYNNQTGMVKLAGGIPDGINTNNALVTKLTFRARSVGTAVIKIGDESRVLLHDGMGTDALTDANNGVYDFILPPPQGPLVASDTHPEESQWYSSTSAVLRWEAQAVITGYSYVLNNDPVGSPDQISEGLKNGVSYTGLADGRHYFHIRSQRGGVWGGVTHFAVQVDSEPPAEFPVVITPNKRTSSRTPIISFTTTDALSGISHYEYKIIPLNPQAAEEADNPFFIETAEQQIVLPLDIGSYDVVVRAHDIVGNFREVTQRLRVVTPIFEFVNGDGLRVFGTFNISWLWIIILGVFLTVGLAWGGLQARRWHIRIDMRRAARELPENTKTDLDELKKYRDKYGKLAIFILITTSFAFGAWGTEVYAQQTELSPPFVETVSRDISNEEIFYIGGKTNVPNAEVIIYLQNLNTGETRSQIVVSDKINEWFYRHPTFLSSGNYLLWTQSKIGDQFSPPSPQIGLSVRATAIQLGSSRLSFEVLYLLFIIILFCAVVGLVAFILFHTYHGRRKHIVFMKEVREAEESVRRGFAVLRRDIEAEIAAHKKHTQDRQLSPEEQEKEVQLLKDLEWVERRVSKEVWDIERVDRNRQ